MMRNFRRGARWLAVGSGVAAGAYAVYAGVAWHRYGMASEPNADEQDPLLDRFMPSYEIADRHHIRVAAPAALTFEVARQMDLQASPVVRTIIRAREIILGATPDERRRPRGLLAEMQSLGWGILAEVSDRRTVVQGWRYSSGRRA